MARADTNPHAFPRINPDGDRILGVYDGQARIGSIVERDGRLLTFDREDIFLGEVPVGSLRDASRLVSSAYEKRKSMSYDLHSCKKGAAA